MEQLTLTKKCKQLFEFTLAWRHLVVKVLIFILMLFIYSTVVSIKHMW